MSDAPPITLHDIQVLTDALAPRHCGVPMRLSADGREYVCHRCCGYVLKIVALVSEDDRLVLGEPVAEVDQSGWEVNVW